MTTGESALMEFWQRRSLRFWLILCMSVAIVPLMAAAAFSFISHERDVARPIAEISREQHLVLAPLEQLPLRLWETIVPLRDYRAGGDAKNIEAYRARAENVRYIFNNLTAATGQTETGRRINEAWGLWSEAARSADAVLSGADRSTSEANLQAVELNITNAARILAEVHEDVAKNIEKKHAAVQLSTIREEVIAFVVSAVLMLISLIVIERSLGNSINQLVEGATRVSEGDRSYIVRVTLPPELRKVAMAFNIMTEHITRQEGALAELARTDGLTGLMNRREFDRVLDEETRRSGRSGQPVGLIMIDIDHFKRFNDTYGHPGGDAALRVVSATVRENIRDIDKAFRFGGEELVAVLPGSDVQAAAQVAERLRQSIAARLIDLDGGHVATVTVSIGVGAYPASADSAETLLSAADAALYRSKSAGRNRVTVCS